VVGGSTIIIISIMDGVDENGGGDCGYRRILSLSLSNGGDAITGIQGGNNEGGRRRRGEEPAKAAAVSVPVATSSWSP
jgi:hypothetical protein